VGDYSRQARGIYFVTIADPHSVKLKLVATKRRSLMSKRMDKSWLVFVSVENFEHDRCVDVFSRPDGSYGFEEFRRDVEDEGQWTPVQYYSGVSYVSSAEALDTAERCVPWLTAILARKPELRMRIARP
jgi:hypothetical protein